MQSTYSTWTRVELTNCQSLHGGWGGELNECAGACTQYQLRYSVPLLFAFAELTIEERGNTNDKLLDSQRFILS